MCLSKTNSRSHISRWINNFRPFKPCLAQATGEAGATVQVLSLVAAPGLLQVDPKLCGKRDDLFLIVSNQGRMHDRRLHAGDARQGIHAIQKLLRRIGEAFLPFVFEADENIRDSLLWLRMGKGFSECERIGEKERIARGNIEACALCLRISKLFWGKLLHITVFIDEGKGEPPQLGKFNFVKRRPEGLRTLKCTLALVEQGFLKIIEKEDCQIVVFKALLHIIRGRGTIQTPGTEDNRAFHVYLSGHKLYKFVEARVYMVKKKAIEIKKGDKIVVAGEEMSVEEVEVSDIGKQGTKKVRIVAKKKSGEKTVLIRPEDYPLESE